MKNNREGNGIGRREAVQSAGKPALAEPVYRNAGDCGLIIEFGTSLDEMVNNAVIAFDAALQRLDLEGVIETTPTIRSVLVSYNPLVLPRCELRTRLSDLVESRNWLASGPPEDRKLWRIPAIYGGEYGPDLAELSDLMEMPEDDIIASHAGTRQRVFMIGFSPGQAYLGGLGPQWDIARLPSVNPGVPAGSILVAIRQTVLYALPNPTGWRRIGRSPFRGFMPEDSVPFKLCAGDEVVFEPVDAKDFKKLSERAARGICVSMPEPAP